MKSDTADVKMRIDGENQVVAQATFPQYDSLDEAKDNEGEARCLEYINAQVRTNEMNRVRALKRGGPSKSRLRQLAISEIDAATWQQIAGDESLIEQAIQRKMVELEERMKSQVIAGATEEDDED